MALQLGLRRGLSSNYLALASKARTSQCLGVGVGGMMNHPTMRWRSTDVGDVIGIDLGTTNSCVSIMVSWFPILHHLYLVAYLSRNELNT
jgi:hypothetical protein